MQLPLPFFSSSVIMLFWFLGCQADHPVRTTDTSAPSHAVSKGNGSDTFNKNCKICHGSDGRLGLNGAKDLSISQMLFNERVNNITNGKNLMPPFGKILTPTEIDDVANFTLQLRK